ncbi:MAG: hypothetical protein OEY24_01750 [Candidatus Bathyarchaeota archaeon]|nr:hypothetical protein [Candidatus Bathyarchaeota archaeon]MDH5494413.1 hypothetical protein [Candidatus Bathyarchaeota archaeon]
MSRKARKSASSLSYYLQKAYWKLVTLKPSTVLLAGIAIATSVFLLGGGIYDLIEQPVVAFISGGRIIPYYPQALNDQLLGESIASMTLYSLGIIGLILMYQSTKYAYSPREAYTTLLIGLILLLIGWVLVEFFLFPSTIKPFQ